MLPGNEVFCSSSEIFITSVSPILDILYTVLISFSGSAMASPTPNTSTSAPFFISSFILCSSSPPVRIIFALKNPFSFKIFLHFFDNSSRFPESILIPYIPSYPSFIPLSLNTLIATVIPLFIVSYVSTSITKGYFLWLYVFINWSNALYSESLSIPKL